MELIALLSSRSAVTSCVRSCLKGYTIYPAHDISEIKELPSNIPVSLIVLDSESVSPDQAEEVLALGCPVLLITEETTNLGALPLAMQVVDSRNIVSDLPRAVESTVEKKRLEYEIQRLRESRGKEEAYESQAGPQIIDSPKKWLLHEKVLTNFAKTLTVNFDLRKLLNHFMDSVLEIIRVNKMSIMLKDKNTFRITAQRGIDPFLAENLQLTNESSLIKWLSTNGRIFCKSPQGGLRSSPDARKEMELLQCTLSFPMIYKGKLIGLFSVDSKITGDPFYKEEIEMIFVLCNYLAAAIKDIDSYHQIEYQKEFTKNILSNMNSGVVTINADERVSIFNQRASEILEMNVMDVLGSDLRKLPSPLGDILYETMVDGRSYRRHEVLIRPRSIPLGINSYRLLDKDGRAIGAVIVFTDLSALKRLEEEKRKTERLQAINNLIGKIAHEIKNPLTSIHTFTQLLEEKYSDEDFREFFTLTVMQSIHQLDDIVDKLVLFSSPLDIRPKEHSVNEIITETEGFVWKDIPPGLKLLTKSLERDVSVKVDKALIVKALSYLILSSVERAPEDNVILLQAREPHDKIHNVVISISFAGRPLSEEEKEMILKPFLDAEAFGIELNVPISQKIIEEHSGTLSITSDSGSNAMIITLPVVEPSNIVL